MSDGYTVKELLDELREETKEQSTVLTRVCTSLEGIEKHLAQLNSKVASHEKRHNQSDVRFSTFQTRASIIFSVIIFVAVIAVNRVIAYIGL
jgi:phage shock protein A